MRSLIHLTFILLLMCSMATAQASAKPGDSAASGTAVNLPSEATVNSFIQQTVGYDSQLSWKIQSIKPAEVPGLAEVEVLLASTEGQQFMRFFITQDGEHAVVGELIPFGARPFDPVKKKLEQNITGPSRGPKTPPSQSLSSAICNVRHARPRSLRSRDSSLPNPTHASCFRTFRWRCTTGRKRRRLRRLRWAGLERCILEIHCQDL